MKITVTKLADLKRKRDAHLKNFNVVDDKLRKLCTHPARFRVTDSVYSTDTIGSNGSTTYYDECELCGASLGEPYGESRYQYKIVCANYRKKKR